MSKGLETYYDWHDDSIHNSELLASSVRLILSGDSTVQFPCIVGTLDAFEEEVNGIQAELKGKRMREWEEYGGSLLKDDLNVSDVDFKAMQGLYTDYFEELEV
jgi:hypothetical protein